MADINIFKSSAYLLYKNPFLFVLPSIGSIISIVSEAFYLVGLYNNINNQNYFPFSDVFVLFLFFISFTIAYFQLILISRKIIPKRGFENRNYYNIIIFELLVIYSFYALMLADIGGYETEMRGKLASSAKTGHFSIYISKINIQNNESSFVNVISFGIPLVLLLSIISMFFNAWMVQYILLIAADDETRRTIRSSVSGLYQSLRNLAILTVHEMDNDTKKNIALLFVLSTLTSIIGFVLTDIVVIPVADGLSLYILQFAMLNIIGAIYSPFFLVCLFLMFMSRPFHIDYDNTLHF
jgi:hypothetical protein